LEGLHFFICSKTLNVVSGLLKIKNKTEILNLFLFTL